MDIQANDYWIKSFDVTEADINRIEEFIEEAKKPQSILDLSKRIVRGRIRFGHDISKSAISSWTGKPTIRLWNPAENWAVGDSVIVVRKNKSDKYDTFVGEVLELANDMVRIHVENAKVWFQRAMPGSENATKWHNIVREIVAQKMISADIDDRVTGIVAQFGDRIISRLTEVLEKDNRFIGYKGNWFLSKLIPTFNSKVTESVFRLLISKPDSLSIEEIIKSVESIPNDIAGGLSLVKTLLQIPEKFHNDGSMSNPVWKVNIQVTGKILTEKYAYDPKTYEIICSPNETITAKTLQKLQELKLLEHVIAF